MEKPCQISAGIVTYKNSIDMLKNVIDSFLRTQLNVKLYVIDNSADAAIKNLCQRYPVEYIEMPQNVGFGAGHNVILKQKKLLGKYHLVLNPDIYFDENVLETLFEYMEAHPNIGNIMPKILYPNGETQYLCKLLPKPINLIGRIFIPFKCVKKRLDYDFEMHFTDYNHTMQVPYLSGCFMFLRREAIEKVGVFDEGIFMYGEDTDLNRRIAKHYQTVFYPQVSVTHNYEKGSYKQLRLLMIHIKSAIYYFNKWGWFFDKERAEINKQTKQQ
ncbi:MAG: glycosyltransferase [Paludibacter sp.]|jgi:GT2 family glycosyltransferase|nr:glycosyltransferase [Paludibacter sp.]